MDKILIDYNDSNYDWKQQEFSFVELNTTKTNWDSMTEELKNELIFSSIGCTILNDFWEVN